MVVPISGLASWLLVAAGGLMTLHVLGINIAPLLTVGGVSGIIVGLSAQSVMSNMISGVNLVREDAVSHHLSAPRVQTQIILLCLLDHGWITLAAGPHSQLVFLKAQAQYRAGVR